MIIISHLPKVVYMRSEFVSQNNAKCSQRFNVPSLYF